MTRSYQQARLSRDPRFDGKFFIAVKTTKIFCRPICPANLPLEKNVEYYAHAEQAMDQGFRPCLRCRPDSAPHSCAWQGVDTTVNRAITLLKNHPSLTIENISEKLGISTRYFRLLFKKHLDITPKKFQLFNQLLFAKKLLRSSNLNITQIALAAGFNSSRRLQQQLKKSTGLTPTQTRRSKSSEQPQETLTFQLPLENNYNWQHIKDFLFLRAIDGIETITNNSYRRTFNIDGHTGSFVIHYQPNNTLQLSTSIQNIGHIKTIISNIERVFDTQTNTQLIQTEFIKAGLQESQITKGLRLPGVWDVFEAGCRAILGQQVSVKAAISHLTLLSKKLGEQSEHGLLFPSPQAIASSDLSFIKLPDSRKKCLTAFSLFMSQQTENNPDDWIDIKGIGPWTVAYAKLRGLSDPDIWLETDLVIKKQLRKYNVDAEQVKPWRSYLTLQLWSMA